MKKFIPKSWDSTTVLEFGVHSGKTFGEVVTKHPDYCEYLREKGMRTEFKMLVRYYDLFLAECDIDNGD